MNLIDRIYTEWPYYGSRRITEELRIRAHRVNRKRIRNLMDKMGICAIYPKPRLSNGEKDHLKYPYLLRGLIIDRPNKVWSADITYIGLPTGFMYLTAIIDWYSRYVLAWRLSNTLDVTFCLEVLEEALKKGNVEIFNTDQGSQYTCKQHIEMLKKNNIQISMDGKGRAFDNIFIERLWRTVKYENIYINAYSTGSELYKGLDEYFLFYNEKRLHQNLGYATARDVHEGNKQAKSVSIVDKRTNKEEISF
jgi:putative transposase